ncbi:D-alanyl-D-alanine carboxypeptidase/D-alanyl-D-alanine-endopeptidase [Roseivivax sp. GX 12232]|uniref:D-alanyl-D-alanine carboxypeptidase/D-alanyl-D-alanine endopeptidase n=1 Tax=Roseivivax sp. GX 12232 TaxID=2900547 RepID=UPI001E394A58|nr:D-alanyl-D-alanine carboxypeptidase/D-alanyl-D-alanine-endopeptidase [Roseivivax sp. GX 12232]MCE0505302.1 D-alanyl-D-alanine carboxypeptidase/D-alanyl-D-alanine-endopeptidase [Roseivivax sp. GX 12232]
MQGLGLAWLAGPAWATAPERSLRPIGRGDDLLKKTVPDLREIVSGAGLNGPSSVAVARVETGEMLENYAGSIGLPPASVAKALTAGYALDTLGGDYRFTTRLLTTTPPTESGAITGDLILAGGGDPTLDTDGLGRLAERLKAAGVTEVRGRLLVWGGALPRIVEIDSEQPDHVGYNPAISGLNLNYNRVHFEWRRAGSDYAVTMDGRSGKYRPEVAMARMVVVARSSPIYTYRDAGLRDDWTVAKSALGDGGARWLPVREPELYAGEVFQTLAGAYGIRLKAPERIETLPQEATEVAALDSAPLLEILEDMLLYSTNLTAEITGLTASAARGVAATDLAASAAAMNTWAQEALGLEKVALVDHSGLGDMSRISAQAMVTALIALRDRLPLRAILKDIPLVDDSRAAIPDSGVEIRAKTGTLNFVSGLAGYETLADGSELAFAIFSADLQRRAEIPMEARERPQGGRTWNGKAKRMQQALLRRWRVVFAEAREQAEVQE